MSDKGFQEAIGDILISLGVTAVFQSFVKKWSEHAGQQFKEIVDISEKRAELLEDIRIMTEANNEPKEILRRHKAAIENFTENRFVALLCKIPKNETDGRRKTLKYLDGLDDEKFNQVLCLLDHDVVMQWIERMRKHGEKVDLKKFTDFFTKMKARIEK